MTPDNEAVTFSVEDRLQIRELISLHGHLVELGQIFTPDVVYDLDDAGGGCLHGVAAIREAAEELGDGNPLGHHVTNVVISETSDGEAVVRSKGIGVRADGTVGSVVYRDVVRRTPHGWRIARRTVLVRRRPLQA